MSLIFLRAVASVIEPNVVEGSSVHKIIFLNEFLNDRLLIDQQFRTGTEFIELSGAEKTVYEFLAADFRWLEFPDYRKLNIRIYPEHPLRLILL
jgi:hypothetical protein